MKVCGLHTASSYEIEMKDWICSGIPLHYSDLLAQVPLAQARLNGEWTLTIEPLARRSADQRSTKYIGLSQRVRAKYKSTFVRRNACC